MCGQQKPKPLKTGGERERKGGREREGAADGGILRGREAGRPRAKNVRRRRGADTDSDCRSGLRDGFGAVLMRLAYEIRCPVEHVD